MGKKKREVVAQVIRNLWILLHYYYKNNTKANSIMMLNFNFPNNC